VYGRNQQFDFSEDDDLAVASGTASISGAEFSDSGSAGLYGTTDLGDDLTVEWLRTRPARRSGRTPSTWQRGPAARRGGSTARRRWGTRAAIRPR